MSFGIGPALAAQEEPVYQDLVRRFRSGPLHLGILLQAVADAQLERTAPGENGFSMANARLLLQGQLDHGFGYFFQSNFVASPAILDARLSYRAGPWIALDVGQFKAPFSAEFLTSASSIDFVNRSAVVTALAPGRQLGVQARAGEAQGVGQVALGVFNGNGTAPNGNDGGAFLYALRGTLAPRVADGAQVVMGINAAYSRDDQATFGGGFARNFSGTRALLGGDIRATAGPYLVSAEVLSGALDPTAGAARHPWGFHATGGYMVAPKVQGLLRWEGLERDDGSTRTDTVILGVNAWPTTVTELQVNYLVDTRDAAVDRHQLLVNFQFGF